MKVRYRNNNKIQVKNIETGTETSLAEFKKENKKDLVLCTKIIKEMILNKDQLEKLFDRGKIYFIKIGNKKYVNKADLFRVLKEEREWGNVDKEAPRLFGYMES